MTREELERLVILEQQGKYHGEQLQEVRSDIKDLRNDNDRRLDELKELLIKAGSTSAPETSILDWVSKNWRPILIVLGFLAGTTSLAEALNLLP